MNCKLNFIGIILILFINVRNSNAQEYAKINKDLDVFKQHLNDLKNTNDENKRNDLLKKLEDVNTKLKNLAGKNILVTPNIAREYPFSYYYVRAKMYLLFCDYDELLYNKTNICANLQKLILTLDNISGDRKSLPFMDEKYITEKCSRLVGKDREEFTTQMNLRDSDIINIYHKHVLKVIDLCATAACRLAGPQQKGCEEILKNYKNETAKKTKEKGPINENSTTPVFNKAKVNYYVSRSSNEPIERLFEKIRSSALKKNSKIDPPLELKVTSFGIYGENKKLDFTLLVNKNMTFTSEQKGFGLGKYRDENTDMALAILEETLKKVYDTLKINPSKTRATITGYADGVLVGDLLRYSGDLQDIKNVQYLGIPKNEWLIANFTTNSKIKDNIEVGFFRAYYPYKFLYDEKLISEKGTTLRADTFTGEGEKLRKVKVVIELFGANKLELDETNVNEKREIEKIMKGNAVPLIAFSDISDKRPLSNLPIDKPHELVPITYNLNIEGGKDILIRKVMAYFKTLDYDKFTTTNRAIIVSDFIPMVSNNEKFVEGYAIEILQTTKENDYVLNCYPLYRAKMEDGDILMYHYPAKEPDVLGYLKNIINTFYIQTFK